MLLARIPTVGQVPVRILIGASQGDYSVSNSAEMSSNKKYFFVYFFSGLESDGQSFAHVAHFVISHAPISPSQIKILSYPEEHIEVYNVQKNTEKSFNEAEFSSSLTS